MDAERRRVFGLIHAGAAAGDPDMRYLAAEFGSPDEILGGPGWVGKLVRDLKRSVPGMVLLALDVTECGALAVGVLRVPEAHRRGWHGPRMMREILDAADALGLDVVCTPTGEYGSSKTALGRALEWVGFEHSPDDPSGHTMRRRSPAAGSAAGS